MSTIKLIILFCFITLVSADKLKIAKHVEEAINDYHEVRLLSLGKIQELQGNNGSRYTPVVFWHGMGDTAFGSLEIERRALESKYPGMQVISIQVGKNAFEDEISGYFGNVNIQIESACKELLNNEFIKRHGSFNAIGFSQGGQFMRGLIQRCPFRENGIQVRNFISLGGQHQGVFGLPNCESEGVQLNFICNHVRELLTYAAYEKNVQENCVQAEYWHDPHRETEYREKNVFLADINNEQSINETYRRNLVALENMVLVEFTNDKMVTPRESSLFGFYAHNQTDKIIRMEDSRLYIEDRIGLRVMDKQQRLRQLEVKGNHLEYKMKWFMEEIASVYLEN